jgi:alkylation response protein AidB-like acyl-CoA dehydrogenase
MDFALTPEQTSFRDEVRSWLAKNLPKDWSDRMRVGSDVPRPEVYDFLRTWQRKMYDAGFMGLTWPKDYGGRGLTFMEEMILHQEMSLQNRASGHAARSRQCLGYDGHAGTAVENQPHGI